MGLRVLYDYQVFDVQKFGGISRYFYELITRMGAADGVTARVAMSHSNNHYFSNEKCGQMFTDHSQIRSGCVRAAQSAERYEAVRGLEWRMHFKLSKALAKNQEVARKRLREGEFDIFHPTYYDPYFLDLLGERPFVLTIFDMIDERWSQRSGEFTPTVAWKKELVQKARRIITISDSAKQDLMDILGTPEGKITTVHLATSIEPCREDADASWLPQDYLLFVGIRRGHKNFAAMFKCLVPVLKARPTLSLVCVGGGPFDEEEKRMFQESGLSGRVIQISASDEQLPVIYHSAAAYLCPSLYEGFGIPTLEAMKCGCPAVLNHTTSLPEIGGDAARYFNMDDPGSLQPALETVLDDAGLRQEMREQGRRQAANFSWERTKQETIEAYHGVL